MRQRMIKEAHLRRFEIQLMSIAFKLTGSINEANKLLEQARLSILNNPDINVDNIYNLKWSAFKVMKDIYLNRYLENVKYPILMDATNDCYLIVNDKIIIIDNIVNKLNKKNSLIWSLYLDGFGIDYISSKMMEPQDLIDEIIINIKAKIERVFLLILERYNPTYVIIWNYKLFIHFNSIGKLGKDLLLPDNSYANTRICKLKNGEM